MLEEALRGKPSDPDPLRHVIERWLGLPGNLTIGVVGAAPIVEAIRAVASRAKSET